MLTPLENLELTRKELCSLAWRHRHAMRMWLVLVFVYSASCLLGPGSASRAVPPHLTRAVDASLLAAIVFSHLLATLAVWRVRVAIGDTPFLACFIVWPSIIPGLAPMIIPGLLVDAHDHLKPAFGRVPFLGVTRAKLFSSLHLCSVCEYDLAGIAGPVCPECGARIMPAPRQKASSGNRSPARGA